ncbi:MAG: hypothetical protein RRY33_06570 [Alistipes sp.]
MKTISLSLTVIVLLVCTSTYAVHPKTTIQTTPRLHFTGDLFAQQASIIFAETLQDMRNKIEDGSNERFPIGFFHTSTEEAGVPQYYNDMWTRDCGRGVVELSRLGFAKEACNISRYFLSHITNGDHWGREINHPTPNVELDGNILILSGICSAWYVNGLEAELGNEFCNGIAPVVAWIDSLVNVSPYGGLLPSISELSGNPSTDYSVYSIFGNYGVYTVMTQIADMAAICNHLELSAKAQQIHKKMEQALRCLVSDGHFSYTPAGCWCNGIDGRNGRAYDISEWDGTSWPIWHWTRQTPYILHYDYYSPRADGVFADIHMASYNLLRHWMAQGEYFRKYGFVSNSGWTGMGGRHDETMCGYGQGFFTQAALLADDVNTYTKCLEGIARLGYDGGVIEQMSYEKNPFVMHECFNYDNYEKGLDHTFGVYSEGRREIMENHGDEGNLVQEAEILKAFSIVAGIRCEGRKLILMPRLPWLWETMECVDWPVTDAVGKTHRIHITVRHERWLRRCTVELEGVGNFESADIRFGPFPRLLKKPKGLEIEQTGNVSWIWIRDVKGDKRTIVVEL